jgi:hypothetical protein
LGPKKRNDAIIVSLGVPDNSIFGPKGWVGDEVRAANDEDESTYNQRGNR